MTELEDKAIKHVCSSCGYLKRTGKITCDSKCECFLFYIAGVKEMQKENEQLKQELLTYKNAICNKECADVWGESERLKEENKRLKARLRTLMPCGYCKHSEKEPVEICTPCLCGECDNWEL